MYADTPKIDRMPYDIGTKGKVPDAGGNTHDGSGVGHALSVHHNNRIPAGQVMSTRLYQYTKKVRNITM